MSDPNDRALTDWLTAEKTGDRPAESTEESRCVCVCGHLEPSELRLNDIAVVSVEVDMPASTVADTVKAETRTHGPREGPLVRTDLF